MTNKPMLSVDRELLERLHKTLTDCKVLSSVVVELRALLDTPVVNPGLILLDKKGAISQYQLSQRENNT